MILDASALIAILTLEPGHEELLAKVEASEFAGVGSPTLVETGMVLAGKAGKDAWPLILDLLGEADIAEIEFRPEHRRVACEAFLRYGKGRHPAGLN